MSQGSPYEYTPTSEGSETTPEEHKEQLRAVATYQRYVLYCLLMNIVVTFTASTIVTTIGSGVGTAILLLVTFSLIATMMFSVYRLTAAIGSGIPLVYALGMIIPCLSLVILLVLSQKATTFLKNHGIRVGLMGANPNSI